MGKMRWGQCARVDLRNRRQFTEKQAGDESELWELHASLFNGIAVDLKAGSHQFTMRLAFQEHTAGTIDQRGIAALIHSALP